MSRARPLTVLIANRGEIATRIIRTAKRMGLRTVAVYSDADANAAFVRAANLTRRIGPAPASESYLRRDLILDAAREVGADLIHPGYGFLSEDADFAKDCEDLGYRFVGPGSDVLRVMGDKAEAKRAAIAAGVPVLPGYDGSDQRDASFEAAAKEIGFPVLVKPAAGGGGKGMTVVADHADLAAALASARRIASAAFGDDRLLLERYLEGPRHVEVQVLADAHGTVLHLFERDCSLQRRHQKVLEESPAPALDDAIREKLHASAVALAQHTGYRNAGTCEFLVGADGTAGFIEMNARLQVEHPVTEMVTGLDLVELQLRIAMGEPLALRQEDVRCDGHAIEVRVYAEDPDEDFLPQAGHIHHVRWPPDARVDAGVAEGSDVSTHYDPMLAKIIVHGDDRVAALWALHRALPKTEILGVRTNIGFLVAVADDPVVVGGRVTTDWLEDAYDGWKHAAPSGAVDNAISIAAVGEAARVLDARSGADPFARIGPWRAGGTGGTRIVLRPDGVERVVEVRGTGPFSVGDHPAGRARGCHDFWIGDPPTRIPAARGDDEWFVWIGRQLEIPVGAMQRRAEAAAGAHLESPLPGQVVAVRVEPGQKVGRHDELVVVEAMKMEHAIKAPADGTVTAVLCAPGDQVDRGQTLVDFDPA